MVITRNMLAGRLRRAEQARALEDHVDAEIAPRQFGRVTLGEDLDAVIDTKRGFDFLAWTHKWQPIRADEGAVAE